MQAVPFSLTLSKISDSDWFELLKQSTQQKTVVGGVPLPGFPSEEVQTGLIGSANQRALTEAFRFYTFVKDSCAGIGQPMSSNWRLLDFGIGWGRIIRFFMKDIEPGNLYGAEVDPNLVKICRDSGVPASVALIHARGSLPYQ